MRIVDRTSGDIEIEMGSDFENITIAATGERLYGGSICIVIGSIK